MYRWNAEAAALRDVFDGNQREPIARPVQLIGLPSAIVALVKHDDYLGVLPEFAVADELREGTIVEIDVDTPRWALDVQMVYRRDTESKPVVQALLKNLNEIGLALKR